VTQADFLDLAGIGVVKLPTGPYTLDRSAITGRGAAAIMN
jgi:hypothetical protein